MSSPAATWVMLKRRHIHLDTLTRHSVKGLVEQPSNTNQVVTQSAQERDSTKKKVKQIPKVYKHLFRHYDDVSFDSWLRCEGPKDFLLSVGFTDAEINHLSQAYPPILQQNVHAQLAPKVRFLVDTLGGGSGTLTWVEEEAEGKNMKFDEECNVQNTDAISMHSMQVSDTARKIIPLSFFKCNLDRSLGPRHAYLVHSGLPSGPTLLKDDARMLKELLDASSLDDFVDLCNRWEMTQATLHTAEHFKVFERIFCAGLIPITRGEMTDGLKHINCSAGRMVKLLVTHGANHLEKDAHGVLPLYWAAGTGSVEGVEALVKAHLADMPPGTNEVDKFVELMLNTSGAKHGATPLHWASCGITPREIGHGGAYNSVYACAHFRIDRPPDGIYHSIVLGSYDVCRLLLQMAGERQAELANALTSSQATPLMWASLTPNLPVIDLLVIHGADPHAVNGEGANAAHWAVSAGHLKVCQYLHEKCGVNFLLEDKYGKTPLDYARAYDRNDVMDWLVHTFVPNNRAPHTGSESGHHHDKHTNYVLRWDNTDILKCKVMKNTV